MDSQAHFVAQVLFWAGALFCIVAPLRLAIPCLGILASVNLSGPGFASATAMGFENAIRIVGLPTLLLWRIGFARLRRFSWNAVPRTWLLLCGYALLASTWTSYPLSAVKMIGYFYAFCVYFVLFGIAWRQKWLHSRVICGLAWITLLLALVQTYLLGNPYGTEAGRLTAFTGPQGFAAFLVCVLALLLFDRNKSPFVKTSIAAVLFGIILTGSRYVFTGTVALFMVVIVARLYQARQRVHLSRLAWRAALGACVAVVLVVGVGRFLPESRAAQLGKVVTGEISITEDIGTFAWRLGVYDATVRELGSRSFAGLLFGSGTSSGAKLLLDVDDRYHPETVDANRVLHNEFLRVLYEWGFIGLAMLLGFLGTLLFRAGRQALRTRSPQAWTVVGILPTLAAGLAIENLLAGSGGPGGIGFVMILSYGFPPVPHLRNREKLQQAPGNQSASSAWNHGTAYESSFHS